MNFKRVSELASLISRDYAEKFFILLVKYRDISASEAASRLNIHIQTAQTFLEGLHSHGIVSKKEIIEKKRPYFRYELKKGIFSIDIDLFSLYNINDEHKILKWKIREKKNSGVVFGTSRESDRISSVQFFIGRGRTRDERKIGLTKNQGKFLFFLPFPTEQSISISDIMDKAKIEKNNLSEILDIIEILDQYHVIEKT